MLSPNKLMIPIAATAISAVMMMYSVIPCPRACRVRLLVVTSPPLQAAGRALFAAICSGESNSHAPESTFGAARRRQIRSSLGTVGAMDPELVQVAQISWTPDRQITEAEGACELVLGSPARSVLGSSLHRVL